MTEAAVLEREKRSTAGLRMSTLVGKAVEDDDEFWNHSTWADEKLDGEESDGSFRESDDDEENQKDIFDSDFNDSESDEDDENGNEKGSTDELELRHEEKIEQRTKRSSAYKEPSRNHKTTTAMSNGRELLQKRKSAAARKKALKGEGINAGLVLNFPGAAPLTGATAKKVSAVCGSGKIPKRSLSRHVNRQKSIAATPSIGVKRSLRASTITTSIQATAARRAAAVAAAVSSSGVSKSKVQKSYTQEELILEALQVTEAENERWILSRKRILDEEQQVEMKKKLLGQNASKGKIIYKTQSRRGCYNTITFPDMDHVPVFFSQKERGLNQRKKADVCVITGKVARYRDPKTLMAYYDLAAFKILRKRYEDGLPLEGSIDVETRPPLKNYIVKNEEPAIKINPLSRDSSGCDSEVARDNSLIRKQEADGKPNYYVLVNGKISSPGQSLQPPEEQQITNTNKKGAPPVCSKPQTLEDIVSSKSNTSLLRSMDDSATPSLESSKERIKSNALSVSTTDSLSTENENLSTNSLKSCSDLSNFKAVKPHQPDRASVESSNMLKTIIRKTPVALSETPGDMKTGKPESNIKVVSDNKGKVSVATIPTISMKIGEPESSVMVFSDNKVKASVATIPITSMKIGEPESSVIVVSDNKVKASVATIPTTSTKACKPENSLEVISNNNVKASVATIPTTSTKISEPENSVKVVSENKVKVRVATIPTTSMKTCKPENCVKVISDNKVKASVVTIPTTSTKACKPENSVKVVSDIMTKARVASIPAKSTKACNKKNSVKVESEKKIKARVATTPTTSMKKRKLIITGNMKEGHCEPLPTDSKITRKVAANFGASKSLAGDIKSKNRTSGVYDSNISTTEKELPVVSMISPRNMNEKSRIYQNRVHPVGDAMKPSFALGNAREENYLPRAYTLNGTAMATDSSVASMIPYRNIFENSLVSPNEVNPVDYAIKKNCTPKVSNAIDISQHEPATKRVRQTKVSTVRKKRSSKIIATGDQQLFNIPPPTYHGDLSSAPSSQLPSMTPNSLFPPLSNFSSEHLRYLMAESNQIPYGYSHSIQPPPIDMASLYSLSLASPLQSVSPSLQLHAHQLHHQRRNQLSTMNYLQRSHLPAASGDIVTELMRAYSMVSATNINEPTQQQQQQYKTPKGDNNGH